MTKRTHSTFQLPRHRRWNADDATRVLAAVEASGKSIIAFADEHGLRVSRILQWRRRLGERPERRVDFHEVRGPELRSVERASGATFDVVLSRGVVLRFGVDLPVERIAAIVDAFEELRSC